MASLPPTRRPRCARTSLLLYVSTNWPATRHDLVIVDKLFARPRHEQRGPRHQYLLFEVVPPG
ncbi:MAG: hypothetical protein U0360_08520 [Dehalococcoidia bacterium]